MQELECHELSREIGGGGKGEDLFEERKVFVLFEILIFALI